jgi:hypothetical protein
MPLKAAVTCDGINLGCINNTGHSVLTLKQDVTKMGRSKKYRVVLHYTDEYNRYFAGRNVDSFS